MARNYRCHSCGEAVGSAQRRCHRCYVTLRGATRGPEPLRASPSPSALVVAPAVNGQLALAAAGAAPGISPVEAPAEAQPVDDAGSPLVRCPACETTVSSQSDRCSYCQEPLGGDFPRPPVTAETPAWPFDDMSDEALDDRPDAQIIVGPWGLARGAGEPVATDAEPAAADDARVGGLDRYGLSGAQFAEDPPTAPAGLMPPSFTDGGDDTGEAGPPTGDFPATADIPAGGGAEATDGAESASLMPKPADAGLGHADMDSTPMLTERPEAAAVVTARSASACATWAQRRRATLIDLAVVIPALVALAFNLTVGAMLVVDAVVLVVWQSCFLQGRTGQTFGKHLARIYLVRESDHGVIGHRMAMWRELCHLADIKQLLSLRLRPYRGARRQTIADQLAGTVVSTQPPAYTLSGRGKRLPAPPLPK